ncbi:MAG: DUF3775 domain-containing protein [Alphaproteobacteria bacterium]|nr:DUF3775 domain-containing protein [Alphaproteobacteria bacterium SS10]
MLQDLKPETAGYIIVRMRSFGDEDEPLEGFGDSARRSFDPSDEEVSMLLDRPLTMPLDDEVSDAIGGLSVDEQCELIALAWVGRGDYTPAEWRAALRDAKHRWNRRTPAYLTGMTMLADYLEEGLSVMDYDLEAAEFGR